LCRDSRPGSVFFSFPFSMAFTHHAHFRFAHNPTQAESLGPRFPLWPWLAPPFLSSWAPPCHAGSAPRSFPPPARQLHSPPITLFTFSLCAGRYCPPFALDHTRPHPPSFRFTSAEIALGALGAPWHAGCHPRGADLIDSRRRHTTCLGPSAPPAFLPCPAHSGCSGCVPSPPAGCAPHLSPRSEPLFGRLLLPSRQPYLPPPND
jgi:hypothetical protein